MPVIRPIPLRTRGRSWWQRTKAWLWDAREWEVQEDYIYTRTNGEQLLIPAGFRSDFASSPRAFWPVGMDPVGILMVPSLFHDFGYRHDFYLDGLGYRILQGAGKQYHDRLFREVCTEVNGMVVPSTVAWLALDVFGWYSWWQSCKGRTGNVDLHGIYRD